MDDTNSSAETENPEKKERRRVLKAGGAALTLGVAGATGTVLIGSSPVLASEINTGAEDVLLDDEYSNVEEVSIEPEMIVDWADFSDGIDSFDIEISSQVEMLRDEDTVEVDVRDDADFQEPDCWGTKAEDGEDEFETALDIETSGDEDDAVQSLEGDLDDSDGEVTIALEEIQFIDGGTHDSDLFPNGIDEQEYAGTELTLEADITAQGNGGETATESVDSLSFQVVIDHPESEGSETDATIQDVEFQADTDSDGGN